jgi:1-acyl-sn-glycerol-3-phosphate acyltransferase
MAGQLRPDRHPPRYHFPPLFAARVLASIALGRPRDMAADAREALAAAPVRPRFAGEHHIPSSGPLVVVANHYERPGLWVGWGALLATAVVARRRPGSPPVRWVHIAEWQRYNFHGLILPDAFTRWFISRVSRTWHVLPIQPPGRGAAGARPLLRAARVVLDGGDTAIGLFPEGAPSVALREAVPGSGAFLLRLSERGVPILPVGLAEPHGLLAAGFGPPFHLAVPRELPPDERDAEARRQVMTAIARLLPPELQAYFDGEA